MKLLFKNYTNSIQSVLTNVAGEAPSKILLLIVNVHLARGLSVDDFGVWNILWAILVYILISIDWGMSIYGIREISVKNRLDKLVVAEVLVTRTSVATIVFLIALLPIFLLRNTEYWSPLLVATPIIFSAVFFWIGILGLLQK